MNHRKLTDALAFNNPYRELVRTIFLTAGLLAVMTGTHILFMETVFQVTDIQKLLFVLIGGIYGITGCGLLAINPINPNEDNIDDLAMRVIVSLPTYMLWGLLAGTVYIHYQLIGVLV